jgi:peptidoglycan-N-acetylglucosamine deacetylase
MTVLASVSAQAQDAASSASSPAPATYSSCHVDGPYIAMTFDDGPSPGNTTRLLDILKQRNIKVTFFMIGPNVVAHPEGYKFVTVSQLIAMNHPKPPSTPAAVSRTPQQ